MTLHESPAVNGFAPIAGPGATVLILGNAPSVLALAKQQYYGNPQNAFWRVMAELFGCPADGPRAVARPPEVFDVPTGSRSSRGVAMPRVAPP